MNEPIISPWIIYLVGRLVAIKGVALILLIIVLVLLAISTILYLQAHEDGDEKGQKKYGNLTKKVLCVLALDVILLLLVPSKEEAIAMYTASKVTPQTVQQAGETIDKITDKFVDKIIKIKEAE